MISLNHGNFRVELTMNRPLATSVWLVIDGDKSFTATPEEIWGDTWPSYAFSHEYAKSILDGLESDGYYEIKYWMTGIHEKK